MYGVFLLPNRVDQDFGQSTDSTLADLNGLKIDSTELEEGVKNTNSCVEGVRCCIQKGSSHSYKPLRGTRTAATRNSKNI